MTGDPRHAGASLGDPQSWNAYGYSDNDPVNHVDPEGKDYYNICFDGGQCFQRGLGDPYDEILYEGKQAGNVQFPTRVQNGAGPVPITCGYGTYTSTCGTIEYVEQGGQDATGGLLLFSGVVEAGAALIDEVGAAISGLVSKVIVGRASNTVATAVASTVERSVAKSFFEGTSYTDKVLSQMENKLDPYHSFPESVRAFERLGTVKNITGGDGVVRQMLEIPGGQYGKDGVYQFIKNADGTINHRIFVPSR
jgi:hypothetical protein